MAQEVGQAIRAVCEGHATWSEWRIIFDYSVPKVQGLAKRCGLHGSDVDDIVQNVLLRIYKSAAPIRTFEGFLFMTAINEIRRFIKSKAADRSKTGSIHNEPSILDFEAENPGAEVLSAIDRQRIKEIQDCVAEMPSRMAQVFRLRWDSEKSRKEIATLLGISEHTVKNHLLKAMQKVKEHLSRRNLD